MRVSFLGTGSWNLQGDRMGPSFLVETNRTRVLVDAGEGCARQLVGLGVPPESIDAVLLTHTHPDHVAGLLSLFFYLRVSSKRKRALDVIGPPGITEMMEALPRMGDPHLFTRGLGVKTREIGEARLTIAGIRVESRLVVHRPGALGYRLAADGRVVAFSGDTEPCAGLMALARGADLLICEATGGKPIPGHMTPESAGAAAKAAGAKRLALVHIDPSASPAAFARRARAVFKGPVFAARDRQRVELVGSKP